MANLKVQALTALTLGSKQYREGQEFDLDEAKARKLEERKLVQVMASAPASTDTGPTSDAPSSGETPPPSVPFEARAEDAASVLSGTYGIERNSEESATGFLARIAQERAEARWKLEHRSSNITLERERREKVEREREEARKQAAEAQDGARLADELTQVLLPHAGDSEDAVQCLQRILGERDQLRSELEKLQSTPPIPPTATTLPETSTSEASDASSAKPTDKSAKSTK